MNTPPFHELTPAEQERLACLAEECSEVIQIVMKIWRHGYESTHPDQPDGDNNREMLQRELGHVRFWIDQMVQADDVDPFLIKKATREKSHSSKVYLHYQ